MPTVYIDYDERYPDYSFAEEPDFTTEVERDVSKATLRRWKRIRADYAHMQDELETLYRKGSVPCQ